MGKLLTIVCLIIPILVNAQKVGSVFSVDANDKYMVKLRTVDDGLASNSIRKIARTKNGLLFISSYNGISLFDGKNFKNYTTDNTPEIPSNNIYDFTVDKNGDFWIASYSGVFVYDGEKFYTPDAFKNLNKYKIQCVNFDQEGTLWIGTISNGVIKYKNDSLYKDTNIKGIENYIISILFADSKGNMWIGTENGLLIKYNGKSYQKVIVPSTNNGVLSAFEANDGTIYFGTRNGLYKYSNNQISIFLSNVGFINDIRIDKFNNIWMATNEGISKYVVHTKEIEHVYNKNGLNKQIIQCLYFDSSDVIWVGTYRKGLIQLRIGAFQNHSFLPQGISDIPSAIFEKNHNTILVGTDEGKLFELENGIYKKIELKNNVKSKRIKCIYIDSKQNTLVCTYNGLIKLSNNYSEVVSYKHIIPDQTARSIIEDKDGNYWLGTRQSGLYKLNENFEVLQKFNTQNGLSSNFVMSIVYGQSGKIYVSTKNGVDIIENSELSKHIDVEDGLIEGLVFNVYEDKDEILWIATIGGLSMYKKGRITNFNRNNGLIDNKVFDVVEDDLGFLWLPSINGIMRVRKDELQQFAKGDAKKIFSVIFDKSDGILNQQYVSASKSVKRKNGDIIFNTISGISVLTPKVANTFFSSSNLYISKITSDKYELIPDNTKINEFPSSKYLQVEFTYVDFFHPDKVEFLYKLEPFDQEWQMIGSERLVKYTNLPPGTYTFKLKAIIKAHQLKEIETSAIIKLNPAFYERFWFKTLSILLLVILAVVAYKIRIRNIKKQKYLLEKEVKDRTSEILNQKEEIQKNIEELEKQKEEIDLKNEEILLNRNTIEQAYLNLKLLSDLGKEITSSLSETEISKILYQNITILMDADIVAIGKYFPDKNFLKFNTTIFKGKMLKPFQRQLDSNRCLVCDAVKNKNEIVSNNIADDYPGYNLTFPESKSLQAFSSTIIIPLWAKGEISGVLIAQTYRRNAYSDFHLNVMQNLAIYTSIALENTKTYKEIQKQKEELQKAIAAKDRLFSIIGHDLKTPVGTIKSFLDLILENPEITGTQDGIEIFKSMQQSLGSAYTLLDNLLLWARSEKGQLEYNPNDFNIYEPIEESISLVNDIAKSKDIELVKELNARVDVFADKNMITTVLRNLIANAIKFTKKGGKIIVRTKLLEEKNETKNKLIEISIVDNGVGISKENIQKVLNSKEMFTTRGTNKEQGSGLGIGICIDFLEKHGQSLFIENNMDTINEKGSTFKFHLLPSDKSN